MTIGDTRPGEAGTIGAARSAAVRILPLHGRAQPYAWRSPTAIPGLLGTPPTG